MPHKVAILIHCYICAIAHLYLSCHLLNLFYFFILQVHFLLFINFILIFAFVRNFPFFIFIFSIFFYFLFFTLSLSHPPHPLPLYLPVLSTLPEPSAPPQETKCISTTSTSLLVSWQPPPVKSQNGDLTGYRVLYQVVGSSEGTGDDTEPMEEPMIPSTEERVLLQRLEKWTQYRITVSASTAVGLGPESEPLICRTDEDGTSIQCVTWFYWETNFSLWQKSRKQTIKHQLKINRSVSESTSSK